jgi:predicted ferric reductase
MDSTDIYGIFMGSVILFLLISSFSYSIAQVVYNHFRRFFLRQIYFSLLPRWLGGCLRVSRYCGLLMIIYVNANVCLLVVDMKDGSDFTRRLGRAALINLVPLCAGGRFNQIAHVLSSRPDNYLTLHKCIGLVFIIEASLHSILSWLRGDIDLRSWPDKAGLVVSVLHILYRVDGFSKPLALRSFSGTNDLKAASSVGALVLLSIPVLWKWMYEPLSILHLALSATMITSLWFHLPSASITQIPRLYLILAISIFALIKLIFFLKLLFLNVSTELISTATIQQVGENGIEVRVTMPRPLRFRAGQFVFLSIPRLALFQYHPFQVAWEYLSDKSDGGRQVIVIIIQPRHGFTSRLRLAVPFKRYTALVEGPYGNPTKLDQYGTVLLFATGIGIAGQLPYMNEQLRLYREWRTKTRRHVLYWEIDAEGLVSYVKADSKLTLCRI